MKYPGTNKRLFQAGWLFLVWLLFASSLWGDGMKIPAEGIRTYPEIPFQEAFIAHRDGMEILIIQSSIDGEGEHFGWVVPIPAAPTHFEEVAPGVFDVLGQAVAPKVKMSSSLGGAIVTTALLLILAGMFLTPKNRHGTYVSWLVFFFILFLLYAMSLPAISKVRGIAGPIPGVEVMEMSRVGSYTVAVLRGDSPEPLNRWLTENGFQSLPAEADPIIADYISKGWVWVATKLMRQTNDGQTLAPHPLRMDFPAEKPVYPMRLTALNTGPEGMRLELFVATNGTPEPPQQMVVEESAQFSGPMPMNKSRNRQYWKDRASPPLQFYSELRKTSIALPDLMPTLWNGVQLTRMTGVFRSEDMAEDIILRVGPARDQRAQYFSRKAAFPEAIGNAIIIAAGAFLAFVIIGRLRKRPHKETLTASLIAFLGSGLVFFIIFLATMPVVPAERLPVGAQGSRLWHMTMRERLSTAEQVLFEQRAQWTEENLAEVFRDTYSLRFKKYDPDDPFSQPPPIEEASPGNYIILEDNSETVIRLFDYDGAPIDIRASDFAE